MSVYKLSTSLLASTDPIAVVGNLSHAAFGVHAKLGLYSQEVRTDGILSECVVNDVVGSDSALLDELVTAGYLLIADVNGTLVYVIADYAKTQLTNAKRAAEAEKSRQRMAATRARRAAASVAPATVIVEKPEIEVALDEIIAAESVAPATVEDVAPATLEIEDVAPATLTVEEPVEEPDEDVAPATFTEEEEVAPATTTPEEDVAVEEAVEEAIEEDVALEEAVEEAIEEADPEVAPATEDDEIILDAVVNDVDADSDEVVIEEDEDDEDWDSDDDYEDEPVEEDDSDPVLNVHPDENLMSVEDLSEFGLTPIEEDEIEQKDEMDEKLMAFFAEEESVPTKASNSSEYVSAHGIVRGKNGQAYGKGGEYTAQDLDMFYDRLLSEHPGLDGGNRLITALARTMDEFDIVDLIKAAREYAEFCDLEEHTVDNEDEKFRTLTVKEWLRGKHFLKDFVERVVEAHPGKRGPKLEVKDLLPVFEKYELGDLIRAARQYGEFCAEEGVTLDNESVNQRPMTVHEWITTNEFLEEPVFLNKEKVTA